VSSINSYSIFLDDIFLGIDILYKGFNIDPRKKINLILYFWTLNYCDILVVTKQCKNHCSDWPDENTLKMLFVKPYLALTGISL
jgi:hypothetical protein